jgi:hypothetical protein
VELGLDSQCPRTPDCWDASNQVLKQLRLPPLHSRQLRSAHAHLEAIAAEKSSGWDALSHETTSPP